MSDLGQLETSAERAARDFGEALRRVVDSDGAGAWYRLVVHADKALGRHPEFDPRPEGDRG